VKKKKWLRPVLFTLGGGLAGLACYNFVGCAAGGCAIASKPAASGTLCQGCLRNSLAVIQNKPLDFVAHGFFARFAEMDFDAVGGFPYFLYHNRLRGFLYGQRGSSCGGAGLAGFIVHSLSFLLMANAPVTQ
jgi:hypothetical protein